MKIIAFTGMPFSGKTEAVAIAKQRDMPVIRMGDLVWDEVRRRHLPLNSETVGRIASEMREKHGMDYWASKTIEKIKDFDSSPVVVIDGIRNIEEYARFKRDLEGGFLLIAIDVSRETRYKRALSRGREDDASDIENVQKRDELEENWGINTVINQADIHLSNDDDLESFRKKVDQLMDQELGEN